MYFPSLLPSVSCFFLKSPDRPYLATGCRVDFSHQRPSSADVMHTILIIEKLPVVRLGVRNLLINNGFPHEIIESVSLQAVPAELSQPVSLIIIDPAQASESGDRLVYRIRRRFPGVPVLFFCGRDIDIYSPLAVRLGISGFIAKDGEEVTVAAAVRMVLAGMQCFPVLDPAAVERPRYHDLSRLSVRELAVLRLLRQGMRNKEVSTRLCLSEKTVSAHKQNLFRKLGVRSVLQISIAPEEEGKQALRLDAPASETLGSVHS